MKQDLTNLLRAVPFVPFTVKTRDGEVHAVNTVERMSVGNNVCTYIDGEGYVLLHNSLYEPRHFYARKRMLQRFSFAVFSKGI